MYYRINEETSEVLTGSFRRSLAIVSGFSLHLWFLLQVVEVDPPYPRDAKYYWFGCSWEINECDTQSKALGSEDGASKCEWYEYADLFIEARILYKIILFIFSLKNCSNILTLFSGSFPNLLEISLACSNYSQNWFKIFSVNCSGFEKKLFISIHSKNLLKIVAKFSQKFTKI